MSLDIDVEKSEEVAVAKAVGELDYHNFSRLKLAIEECLETGDRNIILDLSGITYLDSAALGSLLYSQKRILERKGQVLLVASKVLMDVLNLTHLDSYFHLAKSVEVAKQSFNKATQADVIPFEVRSKNTRGE